MVLIFSKYRSTIKKSEYSLLKSNISNIYKSKFTGSKVCSECHSEIYEKHISTAHFKSSDLADSLSILGNYNPGKHEFQLNPTIQFKMVKQSDGYFQEAYNLLTTELIYKHRTDIVIGSGTKGQSYLTWILDGLYQQQISYYTPTKNWINSPTYPK